MKITTTVGVDCFMNLTLVEAQRAFWKSMGQEKYWWALYHELLIYKPHYLRLAFKANRNNSND